MRLQRVLVVTLLAVGLFAGRVGAANNGELVQAVGDKKVYYIEGSLKRYIKDTATMAAWGFNAGAIKRISRAELNGHPTGPALTRVINWGGNVYFVDGVQRKYIPDFSVLNFYGYSASDMVFLNGDTFARLSDGGTLTSPLAVRVPKDNKIYLLDGNQRRPFSNDAVAAMWGFNRSNTVEMASAKKLPVGSKVTDLVHYNGAVYRVAGGERYWILSEDILYYSGFTWADLTYIGGGVFARLKDAGIARGPALIKGPGNSKIWLTDEGGSKHHVPSLDILYALGYNLSSVREVSAALAGRYIEGADVTRFMRAPDGTAYYVFEGKRRQFTPDSPNLRLLGLNDSDARDYGWYGINNVASGPPMQSGVQSLEGYSIPATSGKTAREQHLYLDVDEAAQGRTDASAAIHYYRSGTPSASQNGMAGGYGAFGSGGSPASTDQERYYINMRWSYCDWYEEGGSTYTRNCSTAAKNWHRHKKVVVSNPANGRTLIASVEESGPAIWTGRVSGLSPEAFAELDAVTDSNLNYLWAVNQGVSLGRIN